MRRRSLLAVLAAAPVAWAQGKPAQPRLIGGLAGEGPEGTAAWEAEFVRALAAFGWVKGRDYRVEWRYALRTGSEAPDTAYDALARELVTMRPDVLVTFGTTRTAALRRATGLVPIVTGIGDPVGTGFARSLARPGGNVTGVSFNMNGIADKQVEVLRSVFPAVAHLHVVTLSGVDNAMVRAYPGLFGKSVKTTVESVADGREFAELLRRVGSDRRGAVLLQGSAEDVMPAEELAAAAVAARVPTLCTNPDLVKAGALVSYGLYHGDEIGRYAAIVDKILRGTPAGDIPFELPDRTFVAVNRKTAAALGLQVPAGLVARADAVFD